MVKTRKSTSRTSKRKSKKRSGVGSRQEKLSAQKRRKTKTTRTKLLPKSTRRSKINKRTKTPDIIIKRTSGRREKFETDRMAQTVSRSGTPFLLARDVAKTVSEKVMHQGNNDTTTTQGGEKRRRRSSPTTTIEVDGAEVRKMVTEELKERNRPDIASSYSGEQPENTRQGRYELMRENQPLHDADAANQSNLLFDSSTNVAKSTRPSTMKR